MVSILPLLVTVICWSILYPPISSDLGISLVQVVHPVVLEEVILARRRLGSPRPARGPSSRRRPLEWAAGR